MKILPKLAPLLLAGVLFLSGCSVIEKEQAFERQVVAKVQDMVSSDGTKVNNTEGTKENNPSKDSNIPSSNNSKKADTTNTKPSEPSKAKETQSFTEVGVLEGDANATEVLNTVNEYLKDLYVYDYKNYSVEKDKEFLKKWGFPVTEDYFNSTLINVDYENNSLVFPYYKQVSSIESEINILDVTKTTDSYKVLVEFILRNQSDGAYNDPTYKFDDYSYAVGLVSLDYGKFKTPPLSYIDESLFLNKTPKLGEEVLDEVAFAEFKKVFELAVTNKGYYDPEIITHVLGEEDEVIVWFSCMQDNIKTIESAYFIKEADKWVNY